MRVHVLFFGMIQDITGRESDLLELGEGARLEAVFEHYAGRYPRLAELAGNVVLARNQQFGSPSTALVEGDEVALLPPVSGGSGPFSQQIQDPQGHFYALTREPIDVAALAARVLDGRDGARVIFEGVARDNTGGRPTRYLDYEGYQPMAVRVMAEIGRDLAASHAIDRIAIVHRLGRIGIGETSVAIVVSAPHRKPAFEAALAAIDRLKRLVPIWKKEYFADGEVWVEGEWDSSVERR